MTTTTKNTDLRQVLNSGNDNLIADALAKIKAGNILSTIKIVVAALAADASPDITTAAVKAAATITGAVLDTDEQLPAIGKILSLRVTASGTAGSLGNYGVADVAGAAALPQLGPAPAGIGTATLIAGTVTVDTTVTLTANSVISMTPGTITGSTNFASVGELTASRVTGAPGVAEFIIQANLATGAIDTDAAGPVMWAIHEPTNPDGGVGMATLSADGKELTFPNTVTGFILEYSPREDVDLDTSFPIGAP